MQNELEEKVQKYKKLTESALNKVQVMGGLAEREKKIAKDFLEMGRNYFSDANYFMKKGEFLTALAAFSYAHAWLDAGVRAGFFNAFEDSMLFTLP
jgi:uncharacterized protein